MRFSYKIRTRFTGFFLTQFFDESELFVMLKCRIMMENFAYGRNLSKKVYNFPRVTESEEFI